MLVFWRKGLKEADGGDIFEFVVGIIDSSDIGTAFGDPVDLL